MSNFTMINQSKPSSSIRPTNGRQTVGDGAFSTDMIPSVLAVCRIQGGDSMYYYSTAFSGGPGRVVRLAPTASFPFPTPPRDILAKQNVPWPDACTPPLTPDDTDEDDDSVGAISSKQRNGALELLSTLFPRNALGAIPHAKSVEISAPNLGAAFEGVVLDLPGKTKTLYVDGKNAAHVNLRESIVALLDLADERLECSALVLALEKSCPHLGELLHSLMYVGGTVVTTPPFPVDPAYILVGLEI
ncbi:uncharacterized protein PHACADRAFT_162521 [Phanerochaete carnosa HHB-10118-sp]|uniref:Ornithine decarboxylase antizyme n=1 Tax=Phanerochaete carnosa (strain HHB-10118-sp) TaxID=650164 RepID=K5W4S2_PHACS|nr:uncharacterized protein PHACADRAFT_162521 [Phanerochaete carnosa HHB-10118-sp]EKM54150.1 hypothetical protein PHACADRAFT_162521 [Phanerochaete carnosa HHB-10118-sp]